MRNNANGARSQKTSAFKVDMASMNGHVFQCHREIADTKQFSVTIEKLLHHVFKTFLIPTNIGIIFNELKTPSLEKPENPKLIKGMEEDYEIDLTIFGEDVKEYIKRRNVLKDNILKFYSMVWGQCSTPMRSKLGAVANYLSINELKDSAALLR